MAYIDTIFCSVCKTSKQLTINGDKPTPNICGGCQLALDKQEEVQYFAKLDSMTTKERIREIEKWIYLHNKQKHYSPMNKY